VHLRVFAEAQISVVGISTVVAAVIGALTLMALWWTRRADAINSVATPYVDLLPRHPHPNAIKFLQDSGILTLRSRWQLSATFQLGGHDISAHLTSWATRANILMAITAARKHGCDLSTPGGVYTFLISEWSPLQIRQEEDDGTDIGEE
jgi:hypothetical protein